MKWHNDQMAKEKKRGNKWSDQEWWAALKAKTAIQLQYLFCNLLIICELACFFWGVINFRSAWFVIC
jgi:hypothetical protein